MKSLVLIARHEYVCLYRYQRIPPITESETSILISTELRSSLNGRII